MAKLEFRNIDRADAELGDRVVIGRSADHADLVVDDKRLSRKHSELKRSGPNWLIQDLGSVNGTKINGTAITKPTQINDGDEISLGGLLLVFRDAPAPAANADDTGKVDELDLDDLNLDDNTLDLDAPSVKTTHAPEPPATQAKPAAPAPAKAGLKMLKGTLHSVLIPIERFPFTMGRKAGNDLILDGDAQASSNHARLEMTDKGEVRLVDLNSTNGIKVEGETVKQAVIEDGTRIQVGSQVFRFLKDISSDDGQPENGSLGLDDDIQSMDLSELDDDAIDESSPGSSPEGDLTRLEEAEVNTAGTSSGKMVRILEIIVGAVVLAAVAALIVVATSSEDQENNDGGPANVAGPLLGGGKLNPRTASFEADPNMQDAVSIPGWELVSPSRDTFVAMPERGKGGAQVLEFNRSTTGIDRTEIACTKPVVVAQNATGVELKVYVRSIDKSPAAYLLAQWYSTAESAIPAFVDSRAFQQIPQTGEWVELKASFRRPQACTALRVGFGVTGALGRLQFDEYHVEESTGGNGLANEVVSAGSPALRVSSDLRLEGLLDIGGQRTTALASGEVLLLNRANPYSDAPIRASRWLSRDPVVEQTSGATTWSFTIFDPYTYADGTLTMKVESGTWSLNYQPPAGANWSEVGLRFTATDEVMNSRATVRSDTEILFDAPSFETRGGQSRIEMADMQGRMQLYIQQGRIKVDSRQLTFASQSGHLEFKPDFKAANPDYDDLMSRVTGSGVIGQLSNNTRILAALDLMSRYPVDREAVRAGRIAIESVVTQYKLRQRDLNFVVESRDDLARNADQYISAVDEARRLAEEINTNLAEWKTRALRISRFASSSQYRRELARDMSSIAGMLQDLERTTLGRLQATQKQGANEADRLRAIRHQTLSETLRLSAEDHFSSEELVQAQLKLERLIRTYPYARNATFARERLLDIAQSHLKDFTEFKANGLNRMADEARQKGLEIVNFVEESSKPFSLEEVKRLVGGTSQEQSMAIASAWYGQENAIRTRAAAMKESLSRP